jgi:hypothetical protein
VEGVIEPENGQCSPGDKEHVADRRALSSGCPGFTLLGRHLILPLVVSDSTSAGLLTRSRSRLRGGSAGVARCPAGATGSPDHRQRDIRSTRRVRTAGCDGAGRRRCRRRTRDRGPSRRAAGSVAEAGGRRPCGIGAAFPAGWDRRRAIRSCGAWVAFSGDAGKASAWRTSPHSHARSAIHSSALSSSAGSG